MMGKSHSDIVSEIFTTIFSKLSALKTIDKRNSSGLVSGICITEL